MALVTRARKAIDQSSMSLDVPFRYIPLENHQTWTGLGVAPETAMNMVTVYQCVRVLSNAFAQLPLMLYRRRADGGRDRALDHPMYRALHLRPNPDMTSFTWRRLMMVHLATWGNSYSEIIRDPLGRVELWPIRPDRIEPKYDDSGRRRYTYVNPATGQRTLMRPGSVFHVAGLSTNGLLGSSPIADLRSTIGLARTAERFGESFFRNNARPATVLLHPKGLSTQAKERLAAEMDSMKGATQAGKTVVLEEGLDFKEIGIPPEDAQFMETRLFQKRELAGAYGIQPHKIGDLERATFSNIEHQSLEFIQDTMMPWFVLTEQELSVQLIEDDDVYAEFLVDGYLRGDAKTRNEAYAIRWQHGTLSPNEWRAKENDNPLPDGDIYYRPANYVPVNPPEEAPAEPVEDPADMMGSAAPVLRRIKSVEVRCSSCDKLLAEIATPPYRMSCRHCKTVTEAAA